MNYCLLPEPESLFDFSAGLDFTSALFCLASLLAGACLMTVLASRRVELPEGCAAEPDPALFNCGDDEGAELSLGLL